MIRPRQRLPFCTRTHLPTADTDVQIFLLGEAVSLMKDAVMDSVVPVGWPPLAETIPKTIEHEIPLHI